MPAYCGLIISEMIEARASEICQIDGVWVWDCRGRKLKSAYRPRVVPLHPALIAEGFVEYALSRGDRMLFDITDPNTVSVKLVGHIRSLGIKGRQFVHYSWRHDFTSQLDRFPAKVSAATARILTGHAAPDTHERNYIHKLVHELHEAVKLIDYPAT
jgi:integrase